MATKNYDLTKFVTQSSLIEELHYLGYKDVTKRTLRFWRAEGKLPELIQDYTNQWVYPLSVVDTVIQLLQDSKIKISPRVSLLLKDIEGNFRPVYSIKIERLPDSKIVIKFELEDGFILQEMKESDLRYGCFT